MGGRGPALKAQSVTRHKPIRGEWQPTPGVGWQHGQMPTPPAGLQTATRSAWRTWFHAWFASHWTPDDLPILRQVIRLYDKLERGDASSSERSEFRQLADTYGITPKGQQDRRWAAPKADEPTPQAQTDEIDDLYGHLRVVGS